MSSEKVHVVAIITPKDGKGSRVEELLRDMADKVHKNEPDTHKYHVNKNVHGPDIVMIETYKTQAHSEAHMQTDYFKELMQAFDSEGVVAKPPVIMTVKGVAGFESR